MRIVSFLLLMLVVLLGISFAILNSQTVTVNFYIGHAELPLSLLIALAFVLGSLLTIFVALFILVKFKIKNIRLLSRLKSTEKELENLKAERTLT